MVGLSIHLAAFGDSEVADGIRQFFALLARLRFELPSELAQ